MIEPANSSRPDALRGLRAAEYVRMSTEHQRYSTENQSDAIRAFADDRGWTIVRSYVDAGRSGLSIRDRPGLRQLIDDIEMGRADFSLVLVYDVSRWGRFQDTDESAFYEYRCRRAGARVEYCAEQFENDGSVGSDVLKVIKRRMAAEYSRELSVKVFAGHRRQVQLGFRQGGKAGFGLRRALVDEFGRYKETLECTQRKNLQSDRIILVPGPPEEVDTVRWIFERFALHGENERTIAATLNAQKRLTGRTSPWTKDAVQDLLKSEKYIGNNVWNRASFKLRARWMRNEPETWIRRDGAFVAIVDPTIFEKARAILKARNFQQTSEEMLARLRKVHALHGTLSWAIMRKSKECASPATYEARFGGLRKAYALVGFKPRRDYKFLDMRRAVDARQPAIVEGIAVELRRGGASVERIPSAACLFVMNSEFSIQIFVARYRLSLAGLVRWKIKLPARPIADMTVVARLDARNYNPMDYFLLPRAAVAPRVLVLKRRNNGWLEPYHSADLEPVLRLCEAGRGL